MVSGPIRVLVYIASAILIILGMIFIISANLGIIYFFEGLIFLGISIALLVLARGKKPVEIRQTVTVTGPVKVKEIRCPVCGAIIDPTKVQIITGKPYVTCSYCNSKSELTEEPTW